MGGGKFRGVDQVGGIGHVWSRSDRRVKDRPSGHAVAAELIGVAKATDLQDAPSDGVRFAFQETMDVDPIHRFPVAGRPDGCNRLRSTK
jgi:hypothetical protein